MKIQHNTHLKNIDIIFKPSRNKSMKSFQQTDNADKIMCIKAKRTALFAANTRKLEMNQNFIS